jgi:large subunit ribosomal protein L34
LRQNRKNIPLFKNVSVSAILSSVMEKMIKLKKVKRKRKHGFLVRMKSHGGKKLLKRRRDQGRVRLAV